MVFQYYGFIFIASWFYLFFDARERDFIQMLNQEWMWVNASVCKPPIKPLICYRLEKTIMLLDICRFGQELKCFLGSALGLSIFQIVSVGESLKLKLRSEVHVPAKAPLKVGSFGCTTPPGGLAEPSEAFGNSWGFSWGWKNLLPNDHMLCFIQSFLLNVSAQGLLSMAPWPLWFPRLLTWHLYECETFKARIYQIMVAAVL